MRELQSEIDNWKDKHNKTQDEVADLEVKFDQIETENARLRFQLQENEVWVVKFPNRNQKNCLAKINNFFFVFCESHCLDRDLNDKRPGASSDNNFIFKKINEK